MSPVEIMFGLVVACILAVAVAIAPSAAEKPLAIADTIAYLNQNLSQIDARRLVTGNGASLVVEPTADGGSTITRYDGRPNGGLFQEQGLAVTSQAPVSVGATTSFVLMASSEGQIVEAPYSGSTTTAWPTCTTITITVGTGGIAQTMTVSCAEAGQGG